MEWRPSNGVEGSFDVDLWPTSIAGIEESSWKGKVKPVSMCEAVEIGESMVSNGMLSILEAVRVYLYRLEAARKKYETLDPLGSTIEPLDLVTDLDGCKWGCGSKISSWGLLKLGIGLGSVGPFQKSGGGSADLGGESLADMLSGGRGQGSPRRKRKVEIDEPLETFANYGLAGKGGRADLLIGIYGGRLVGNVGLGSSGLGGQNVRHFVVGSPVGSHPTMASSNMESSRVKCNTLWSSLFCTLKSDESVFTPPKLLGDAVVVEPSEEVLEMGCELRENSLVGHFVDASLSLVRQRLEIGFFITDRDILVWWSVTEAGYACGQALSYGVPMGAKRDTSEYTEGGLPLGDLEEESFPFHGGSPGFRQSSTVLLQLDHRVATSRSSSSLDFRCRECGFNDLMTYMLACR
ncbi:unnamed protein product [Citrullus colocynthis]|uniref:Uncharacterized protein n=1 Tax=Citrullus colocynthis TaxID=252529 RepID=A0ABP0XUM6_9ROSI